MMKVVRFVGEDTCSDAAYLAAVDDGKSAIVDSMTGDRNVTVQFTLNESPLLVEPDEHTRDFLDLAVAVYIADELINREDSSDRWTRDFDLLVPVFDPERWQRATSQFASTLSFLSQDRFAFNWVKRTALPEGTRHRQELPDGFDTVCLFSGGIDSLLGANRLLQEGQKVLLVGHQAEGATAKAQKDLYTMLASKYDDHVALIQCRVARSGNETHRHILPNKVEESHRPRSFLFLALALAIANAARIQSVFIPENGMIALNPPLQRSRAGAHATRTAHPIFLARLINSLRVADVFAGEIRNPFLYVSKTDMLRELDPSLVDLVKRSVSCSHPLRYQDEGVHHCGYCVPCLHRRAAMMVCGLDDSDDYAFDVLLGTPSRVRGKEFTSYLQLNAKALFPFARLMTTASDVELHSRVLSHGYFPASVGETIGLETVQTYQPWAEMIRRWATDLVNEFETRLSDEMKERLGFSRCPERRVI
jgi:7-cyano-7-deazaguanine synthase in queuosine biosynthesis